MSSVIPFDHDFSDLYLLDPERQKILVKYLCRKIGIKIRFRKMNLDKWWGYASSHAKKITIASNSPHILSIFFHELGHIVAAATGKWPAYHDPLVPSNKKKFLALARTALRAELWVDKWGEREFKKLFPHLPYIQCYRDANDRALLDEHVESIRREMWNPPPMIKRVADAKRKKSKSRKGR